VRIIIALFAISIAFSGYQIANNKLLPFSTA